MKTRPLGKTGIELPILSFGASSLGQEFRSVALDDALKSVQVALDCGLNFIDTSPFYGLGMSELVRGTTRRARPPRMCEPSNTATGMFCSARVTAAARPA